MKYCDVTKHNHRPLKDTALAPVQTAVRQIAKPAVKPIVKPTIAPVVQPIVRPMNKLPPRSLQRTSLPNLLTYSRPGKLMMTKIPKENFRRPSLHSHNLSVTEDFSSEVTDEVELVTNDKDWTLMFLNGYKFTKYFENKTCVSYRCTMYPKQASDCQARLKHNKLTKNVFMRSDHNHPADEGAYAQFVKSAISVKRIKDMSASNDVGKRKSLLSQQHLIKYPKRINRETPSTYKRSPVPAVRPIATVPAPQPIPTVTSPDKDFDENIVIKEEIVDDVDNYINCVQVEMDEEAQDRD